MELILSSSLVTTVLAGIGNPVLPWTQGATGPEMIGQLLSTILTLLLTIGAVASIFYLIIGAYQLMAAGGERDRIQGGREKITNALMALVILFSIFAIAGFLGTIFEIDIFNLPLPTIGSTGNGNNGAVCENVGTNCIDTLDCGAACECRMGSCEPI